VIELKDEALVQRVVDGVMKDLPAISPLDSINPLLKKPGRAKRRR